MPGSLGWCLAHQRHPLTGGCCVSGNSTLQSSITLEPIDLHTNPIGNKSQSWQQTQNSPHQSQLGSSSRQQVVTGKIPGLDCKESWRLAETLPAPSCVASGKTLLRPLLWASVSTGPSFQLLGMRQSDSIQSNYSCLQSPPGIPTQGRTYMSPHLLLGDSDDPGGGGGYTRSPLHTRTPRVGSNFTNMPTISPFHPPLQPLPANIDSRMVSSSVLSENLLVEI